MSNAGRPPRDSTHIGQFRKALSQSVVEGLLKTTIDAAVAMKVIQPTEFKHEIVAAQCSPRPSPIR